MRVAISSGHGLYIRGARGDPVPPQLDEVDEARELVEAVAHYLRLADVEVETFHDNTSRDVSTNLNAICDWHNDDAFDGDGHDFDISIHFNAYDGNAHGTEVCWYTQEALAAKVSAAISDAGGFTNRGPKYRDDLKFLKSTDEPAILIETCFCDHTGDSTAGAIAVSISGEDIEAAPPDRPERPERPERPPPGIDRPEPPNDDRPTLAQGDTGEDVAGLQRSLGLPDDGDFGPTTDAGVRAFQGACGLGKDGEVGTDTWAAVDELDAKMAKGADGIGEWLATKIDDLVERSGLADYSWEDRGTPPPGYVAGMAKIYALALGLHKAGNPAVMIMAHAETDDEEDDALAWYHDEFESEEMDNSQDGVDTLRHLFVLMIGLGMRESSGDCWEGRDMSADNVESDTAEAGLFQSSWNLSNCSDTIDRLLAEYWNDPNGFGPTFRRGLYPSASQLDCYGSGDGAKYQWLARFSPAFAALMTGVGMRLLGGEEGHWGPIRRHEVELAVPEFDDLLKAVERLVDDASPEIA
jgi:hypothetical protein